MMPPNKRSQATADVRSILVDLMGWHINQLDGPSEMRELKKRVIELTGRDDLIDHHLDDIALHTHLIDAVEDYQEGL